MTKNRLKTLGIISVIAFFMFKRLRAKSTHPTLTLTITNFDLFVENDIETMKKPVTGDEIVGKVDQKGNTIRAYN
jgi:hypothetical protein